MLLGSECHICPLWSFMSSLVKCVVSDYSGKKYGRSRGVLEIWNEIMSNQLEGLVQFPIWSFFFVRRYC